MMETAAMCSSFSLRTMYQGLNAEQEKHLFKRFLYLGHEGGFIVRVMTLVRVREGEELLCSESQLPAVSPFDA